MVSTTYGTIQIGIIQAMDWSTIREVFKATRTGKNKNQVEIHGTVQAMVSKIENNRKKGPTVETFVRAVIGLGMPVSHFFALVEARSEPAAEARPLTEAPLDEQAKRNASNVLRAEAREAKERHERDDQEKAQREERERSMRPVEPFGESRHPLSMAAEQSEPHPTHRLPSPRKRAPRRRLPPKRRRLGKKR